MTLQIRNLTKIYGRQRAVDNISFEVGRGEIVGFLGPNGAGKSTTMKIATTYLPPTSGSVVVEGMDVSRQPQKIKRIIGYLPEHNPLYTDLYVREYLRFAGRFYGLRGHALTLRCAGLPRNNINASSSCRKDTANALASPRHCSMIRVS